MTPAPPLLPPIIASRTPEELFYVVKHGIKFTSMPAWPSLVRDDEVRAVVAFLRVLPDLDENRYQRMVEGRAPGDAAGPALTALTPAAGEAPRAVLETCAGCHGIDGRGRNSPAFPALAGQRLEYLRHSLEAYARARRHSGIMQPIAAGLSDADMRVIAEYYAARASREAVETHRAASAGSIDRGAAIALNGIPAQGVPSCIDCHGPREGPINPAYPSLAGQFRDYLVLQLELFRDGRRGGSAYAHLMQHVAPKLTRQQMRDVALYYATLPPAGAEPAGTPRGLGKEE